MEKDVTRESVAVGPNPGGWEMFSPICRNQQMEKYWVSYSEKVLNREFVT